VYLLFADESGTHGGSHAFVVGGIAVHEQDAQDLQRALNKVVESILGVGQVDDYELHAAEMRNAKRPPNTSANVKRPSLWAFVARQQRLRILDSAYEVLRTFQPASPSQPVSLFGVVIDQAFRRDWSVFERERFAYEVLLNKFDTMLKRIRTRHVTDNRGLVIHDRRVVAERDIQDWTKEWQKAAGSVGQLRNLADVPLFADSRASRLIQAADLVSYALYRHYDPGRQGKDYVAPLWSRFDTEDGALHGCIHFTPLFAGAGCPCTPCSGRST
jgi:hypothetical protein